MCQLKKFSASGLSVHQWSARMMVLTIIQHVVRVYLSHQCKLTWVTGVVSPAKNIQAHHDKCFCHWLVLFNIMRSQTRQWSLFADLKQDNVFLLSLLKTLEFDIYDAIGSCDDTLTKAVIVIVGDVGVNQLSDDKDCRSSREYKEFVHAKDEIVL
ncbi:uncharacterized protein LOC129285883 isoform X2 [Prosopis cineraria]|uniref:uncharacterized protein LOC129285883 isoform X2 n=1 Tax=Prosopis cineraria TaxID=364024 RepID=UPI00240FE145|nr:uncharacterized protein LOC129285883 isoform X2 [Prosopis cineraria]XP_054777813.1 uncharacterized protein LOC129285883 isoform X2 [Prosopis cineraria]